MYRAILGSIASLTLFSLVGSPGQTVAGQKPVKAHPHHALHHALFEARLAHHELKESKEDFGPQKEKALHAIHGAIKQIEIMLKSLGDNERGEPTKRDLKEEYKKYAHHPHLHHAIHELRHAHMHLKETKHDYGGHREKGLHDIHHAIHELEVLLKIDRKKGV